MAEPGGDQVGHEDEVARFAIASGARLGRLDQAVDRLHGSIAQGAVEAVEDAVPVSLQGQGELLEGRQPAAARPLDPAGKLLFGCAPRVRHRKDISQGLLHAERAACLQMHARQLMVLRDLPFGPAVLVLEPHPSAVLEGGLCAHLSTPDLFQRGVGQLDDVEPVEGDGRVRQMSTDARNIGPAHVDAGGRDSARVTTMSAEVASECFDGVRVAALTGKEQSARIEVMEQGDVIVATPRRCFVDTNSRHVAEILQRARRRDVVVKHTPNPVVADLEKICNGLHGHLSGQGDHEGVKQLAEAAATAGPGNRELSGLAALRAGNAGNAGVDEGLVFKEAKMLPAPGPCVVDRLIGRAAGRASEPGTRLEADLKVDLLDLGIKAHIRDAPRRLQAKRHREQARLRPHGSPPSAGLRERYSAQRYRGNQ